MYQQFIKNLSADDVVALSRSYFNIEFTKEEIEPVLPYLQQHYQDYFDPELREQLLINVKEMTRPSTYAKMLTILRIAETRFAKK